MIVDLTLAGQLHTAQRAKLFQTEAHERLPCIPNAGAPPNQADLPCPAQRGQRSVRTRQEYASTRIKLGAGENSVQKPYGHPNKHVSLRRDRCCPLVEPERATTPGPSASCCGLRLILIAHSSRATRRCNPADTLRLFYFVETNSHHSFYFRCNKPQVFGCCFLHTKPDALLATRCKYRCTALPSDYIKSSMKSPLAVMLGRLSMRNMFAVQLAAILSQSHARRQNTTSVTDYKCRIRSTHTFHRGIHPL